MMMVVASTAPDNPAARAKGTVRPSDMPITMSRTVSEAVKCLSTCGVCGMATSCLLKGPCLYPTGVLYNNPGRCPPAGDAAYGPYHPRQEEVAQPGPPHPGPDRRRGEGARPGAGLLHDPADHCGLPGCHQQPDGRDHRRPHPLPRR